MRARKRLILRLGCGLGNQMFEFARAAKLAREIGDCKILIDRADFFFSRFMRLEYRRKYELDAFPAVVAAADKLGPIASAATVILYCIKYLFGQRIFGRLLAILDIGWVHDDKLTPVSCKEKGKYKTLLLSGMVPDLAKMPSRSECRELFALKTSPDDNVHNSVSIHIRRTDYVALGAGLSLRYYKLAMEEMSKRVESPLWMIFSDDIEWCRRHFKGIENIVFVNGDWKNPVKDLQLMAKCSHHIIANSTFSWWGAFLGGDSSITIYPDPWFSDSPDKSFIPPDWIAVSYL